MRPTACRVPVRGHRPHGRHYSRPASAAACPRPNSPRGCSARCSSTASSRRLCLAYRQPLVFFWTIPGTVLVVPALCHLSLARGGRRLHRHRPADDRPRLTGRVRRAMAAMPMPIVMGMVAACSCSSAWIWVRAFQLDVQLAAAMTAVFLLTSAVPRWPRASAHDDGAGCRCAGDPPVGHLRARPRPGRRGRRPARCRRRSSPGRRSSSWWCRSRSPCWWCRTARASPS